MRTTAVPWSTCDWFGHSTFFSSPHDSETNRRAPPPGVRRRPNLSLAGARACDHLRVARRLLLGPPGSALLSRLLGHQRVSRCRVWWPHQRQYLRNSTRSGEFRFDFCVW